MIIKGKFLLIEIIDGNRFFYVVSTNTLESTFVKLYFLNNYNNNFFQLVKMNIHLIKFLKLINMFLEPKNCFI